MLFSSTVRISQEHFPVQTRRKRHRCCESQIRVHGSIGFDHILSVLGLGNIALVCERVGGQSGLKINREEPRWRIIGVRNVQVVGRFSGSMMFAPSNWRNSLGILAEASAGWKTFEFS